MTTQLSDSAANIQANIDTLETQVTAGQITSITLTDANTPTLTLTAAQFSNDSAALNAISGNYFIDVTGVGALNAQIPFLNFHVAAISVSDNGLSIGLELDTLEGLAHSGKLLSVTLTGGTSLTVTQAQLTSDADALAKFTGTVDFSISAPSGSAALTGLSGHSNIVNFTSGLASQFTFSSNGQTLTASNGLATYQLSNIEALHFTDGTQLIVAQTPGDANHVNTGNITELYSAVLAREPDLDGLSFYQNYLTANPTTSLQTFATYFLSSTEYTSAHNYPLNTAGDAAFITDSYHNLLNRTPSASEVDYYLNNVLEKTGVPLTATAQLQAHALMLVYFSASSEFLGDVQVTAANTGSAQHWLVLT